MGGRAGLKGGAERGRSRMLDRIGNTFKGNILDPEMLVTVEGNATVSGNSHWCESHQDVNCEVEAQANAHRSLVSAIQERHVCKVCEQVKRVGFCHVPQFTLAEQSMW